MLVKKTKMVSVVKFQLMYVSTMMFSVTFHSVLLSLLFLTLLQSCCSAKLHVSGSCSWASK